MKISYDQTNDSLYVHLTNQAGSDVGEVESGVVVDVDSSGATVGIDIQQASQRADFTKPALSSRYRKGEDLFQLCLSNKQIVREDSLDWHSHISYTADKSIVEIVLLDAKKSGALPLSFKQTA
jgi:uncharacterized protein YuzE